MPDADTQRGFTLVEVSIVIVIIGLIIGSVLGGKELIRAAMIRQTIQQYEQFNTATQAFRLKYDCLPGDCKEVEALGAAASSAGNGDGLIGQCAESYLNEPCSGFSAGNTLYMELFQYWYHLSVTNLIKYGIPVSPFPPPSLIPGGPYTPISNLFTLGVQTPKTKISAKQGGLSNGGWSIAGDIVFDASLGGDEIHAHGFIMGVLWMISLGGGNDGQQTGPGGFNGIDLYAIDSKLDDALPLSGGVRAFKGITNQGNTSRRFTLTYGIPYPESRCINTTVNPYIYNTQYTGDYYDGLCSLVILGGF